MTIARTRASAHRPVARISARPRPISSVRITISTVKRMEIQRPRQKSGSFRTIASSCEADEVGLVAAEELDFSTLSHSA